ncbi:hypothetical protein IW262DRAFT_1037346 [Armillaria fumosa]|nr:hypothetical protein IW262DRAFT_1037346 [Armillaria fumosa]
MNMIPCFSPTGPLIGCASYIPAILAHDPHKCGDKRLWTCLTYFGDQLGRSGQESVIEALDADILATVLKFDRVFPQAYEALVDILDGIQTSLIFRKVERSARKALHKIEQPCLDADWEPGPTKDAWLATKAYAQHFRAFKNYYHTLGWDNRSLVAMREFSSVLQSICWRAPQTLYCVLGHPILLSHMSKSGLERASQAIS